MATFKKFEDIKAWQKARRLTSKIYNVTGSVRFAFEELYSLLEEIGRMTFVLAVHRRKPTRSQAL